ncbi:MAG: AraC family transcriptional regulator [Lentimonas sp.]
MASPKKSQEFLSRQVVQSRYLFLDLAPESKDPLVLTCAGREDCASDYVLNRDGFDYFAVELVLSGSFELTFESSRHELGPGSIFTYTPGAKFALKALGNEPPVKYFVDFSGSQAAQELEANGLAGREPLFVMPTRWVQGMYEQILDCSRYPKATAKEMSTLLMRSLLLRIGQDVRPTALPLHHSFETYQRCREYIYDHFKTLHSMKEVSEVCHVDRAYLSRLFKKHTGEGPYQFLIRMKMESAAEALRFGNASVKAAAADVGFDDPFHFSRVFKKTFGLSPKQFAQR